MKKTHDAQDDTFSFLEFGAISRAAGTKQVYDFRSDQDAYDWFMHARYSQDLVTYLEIMDLLDQEPIEAIIERLREKVHHANDFRLNLAKLAAVNATREASFFEFGQTLFGCIDGMAFCKALLSKLTSEGGGRDLPSIAWTGYDTSEFFNRLAGLMHQSYEVMTSSDFEKLEIDGGVAFAKGVTLLYAIDSLSDFNNWFGGAELTLFDYSFALGPSEITTIGTGKEVTHLSLDDFMKTYNPNIKPLFVRGNSGVHYEKNRLFVEGVWGASEACGRYIELEKCYWNGLGDKALKLTDIDLVAQETWTELSEFITRLERV